MQVVNKFFLLGILYSFTFLGHAAEVIIGAGFFTTSLPKYIGADEQENYTLPFPYFYYKTEKLKIDRNAFTGFLWRSDNWVLDLSASGNIPVKSSDTLARKGMKDIDWVGELGPALKYYLIGKPSTKHNLSLHFSLRKAFATDLTYLETVGWRWGPSLSYQKNFDSVFQGELLFNAAFNLDFAEDDYLNYYYGVSPQEQTETRTQFYAESGYQGSGLNVGFTWKKNDLWLGSFIKYYQLNNSKHEYSPLVGKNNAWSAGFGVAWFFYKKQ